MLPHHQRAKAEEKKNVDLLSWFINWHYCSFDILISGCQNKIKNYRHVAMDNSN